MRNVVQVALLFAFLTAISVVVAGVASTFALGRAQVGVLDADLAAIIRADYSADPDGKRLAPLDTEIGEAVRQDELRLEDKNDDVEIVDVFYVDPPENTADEGDPESGTQTPTPTPSPEGGSSPVPGTTPAPGSTPTPTPKPGPAPTPTPTPIPELRGALFLDSGEDPSVPGGPPAAGGALWVLGERLLVRLENLDSQRFPGGENCETRIKVGPVDENVAITKGVAELDIQKNVPVLVPGTLAEVRIRCEFQDEGGERQRHETRWRGTLESVTLPSGVSLEGDFEIVLDPQVLAA